MLLKFSIKSNICELVYFISALEICQFVNVAKSCLQTTKIMCKVTKILQLICVSVQNLGAWLFLKENPPLLSNCYCSVFFQRILKLCSDFYSPIQLKTHWSVKGSLPIGMPSSLAASSHLIVWVSRCFCSQRLTWLQLMLHNGVGPTFIGDMT